MSEEQLSFDGLEPKRKETKPPARKLFLKEGCMGERRLKIREEKFYKEKEPNYDVKKFIENNPLLKDKQENLREEKRIINKYKGRED